MKYLLDANVMSEFMKTAPDNRVLTWWESTSEDSLYLSVITLGEVRKGIERLRPRDPQRAASYEAWLAGLEELFCGRVEVVDYEIANEWGRLTARPELDEVDALLAATAIVRGWTLVTRNVRDVEQTGCLVLNPFS